MYVYMAASEIFKAATESLADVIQCTYIHALTISSDLICNLKEAS